MRRMLERLTADDGDAARRIYEARLSFEDAGKICLVMLALAAIAVCVLA